MSPKSDSASIAAPSSPAAATPTRRGSAPPGAVIALLGTVAKSAPKHIVPFFYAWLDLVTPPDTSLSSPSTSASSADGERQRGERGMKSGRGVIGGTHYKYNECVSLEGLGPRWQPRPNKCNTFTPIALSLF
uniref:Uncharacterized protein n=1 Tax=Oryza sativa subsp. japonica TaxID=39947 RepID=Q6EUQ2_ORYSJ|nr:hypothetical protein [Oryza sativa Japonica Group]